MQYILIAPTGKIYMYYILECAKCYQTIHGGTLIESLIEYSPAEFATL